MKGWPLKPPHSGWSRFFSNGPQYTSVKKVSIDTCRPVSRSKSSKGIMYLKSLDLLLSKNSGVDMRSNMRNTSVFALKSPDAFGRSCSRLRAYASVALLLSWLAACGDIATKSVQDGVGANPVLPEPRPTLIPTVNIAPAEGWPDGKAPKATAGFRVDVFASNLDHPRWLYVLPNGDVLVAETNAPPKPDDAKGLRGWVMNKVMQMAGATVPSANRITLLRPQAGGNGTLSKSIFLAGLHSPFGMVLVGNYLYVADTDAVLRFPYKSGDTAISESGTTLLNLPAGTINHHWTKNIVASRDGARLYVSVGSNSNVGENGLEQETGRAAVWEIDIVSGSSHVYAGGLRNPVGMSWQPQTGELWVAVNERDQIGSDLVPDYMTAVHQGEFYGWPYSYYGRHIDARVKPARPDLVATARQPDYALGAHTASLGLVFYDGDLFPQPYKNGAFIGQHGSWNRNPHSGYKVTFVPFQDGKPNGAMTDFLTGFLSEDGHAYGRPVGVAVDHGGALLVADDVGNKVWRVSP